MDLVRKRWSEQRLEYKPGIWTALITELEKLLVKYGLMWKSLFNCQKKVNPLWLGSLEHFKMIASIVSCFHAKIIDWNLFPQLVIPGAGLKQLTKFNWETKKKNTYTFWISDKLSFTRTYMHRYTYTLPRKSKYMRIYIYG